MSRFPLLLIIAVLGLALVLRFAPRCKPGDPGITIGGAVLIAGCRPHLRGPQ